MSAWSIGRSFYVKKVYNVSKNAANAINKMMTTVSLRFLGPPREIARSEAISGQPVYAGSYTIHESLTFMTICNFNN